MPQGRRGGGEEGGEGRGGRRGGEGEGRGTKLDGHSEACPIWMGHSMADKAGSLGARIINH